MRRTVLSVTLFAIAATALVGCSALSRVLHHETEQTYSDVRDLGNWVGDAPWVPADSHDIRVYSSTNGMVSEMRVVSDETSLTGCTEVTRLSLWAFTPTWAPSSLPGKAWACGAWDVVPIDGGWFGWTPNDPDEEAASTK